jgi:hypothetical protein
MLEVQCLTYFTPCLPKRSEGQIFQGNHTWHIQPLQQQLDHILGCANCFNDELPLIGAVQGVPTPPTHTRA